MLNELTPQQEQLMHDVREEWLAKIFDPEKRLKADAAKAEQKIQWLYSLCKLPEPQVLFALSPMHAQYLANQNNVWTNVETNVWANVCANVWANFRNNVEANVRANVSANIRANVSANVWDNVYDNVSDNVWANVRDNVRDNVETNVISNLSANVSANVSANIRANVRDNVSDNVSANVSDNVSANVRDNVRNNVETNVRANVCDNVCANVYANVSANIRANVRDNVRDNVSANVYANVYDNVWDNVSDNVRNNVRNNVETNVYDNVWDNVRDYHKPVYWCEVGDYGWASFYEFFYRIGIIKNENFNQYLELLNSGIWNLLTFENVCIACPLPSHIYRTDPTPQLLQNQKLHSTERMAIEWEDGYGQYYLHGVYFDKELWDKVVEPSVSLKEVMAIENMEQRMAAIKTIGYEHLLADAEKVDSSKRGNNLYLVKGVFSTDAYFLQYKDPSTNRIYVSGIDPEVGKEKDADLSMAWKFNMTKEEYANLILEA